MTFTTSNSPYRDGLSTCVAPFNQSAWNTTYTARNSQSSCSEPALSRPIVIPQRRPGSKERGFILAYPPVLENYGISQTSFLEFIQECNTAMPGNAALSAVGAAGFGAGLAPEPISMLVGAAVQFGAAALNRNVVIWKTNWFLDKCNNELFSPRGLMCFISVHDPGADVDLGTDQQTTPIASKIENSTLIGDIHRNLRDPYSRCLGIRNMQDATPLVYLTDSDIPMPPETRSVEKATVGSRVKNAYSDFNNYLDKRSRAIYVNLNALIGSTFVSNMLRLGNRKSERFTNFNTSSDRTRIPESLP